MKSKGDRPDGRRPDELRPVRITRSYLKDAEGSVLMEMGDTRVICTATLEEAVPPFLRGKKKGWVTAEYGMLPRSSRAGSRPNTGCSPDPPGSGSPGSRCGEKSGGGPTKFNA